MPLTGAAGVNARTTGVKDEGGGAGGSTIGVGGDTKLIVPAPPLFPPPPPPPEFTVPLLVPWIGSVAPCLANAVPVKSTAEIRRETKRLCAEIILLDECYGL